MKMLVVLPLLLCGLNSFADTHSLLQDSTNKYTALSSYFVKAEPVTEAELVGWRVGRCFE